MPWDEYFGNVLGGAAYGGLRAGRGATFAEILAGAALGSSEARYRMEELRQRQAEFEERKRQEEEDRALRLQEREIRMKALADQQAAQARQDEAGRVRDAWAYENANPDFMGPHSAAPDPIPQAAFSEPGQYAEAMQAQASRAQESELDQQRIAFILSKGGQPGLTPQENAEIFKNIIKGEQPLSRSEALAERREDRYERREAQGEQDDLDAAWKEWQQGAMSMPYAQARVQREQETAWNKAFARNQSLVMATSDRGTKSPDEIKAEAEALTISEGVEKPKSWMAPKPKPTDPIASFAGNLPTTGAPVASPSGTTAPPGTNTNRTLVQSSNLDTAIDSAVPGLPPQIRAQVKARITKAVAEAPAAQRDAILQQYLDALRAESQGLQFGSQGGLLRGNAG